jgi:hypothetical protein
MAFKFANLHMSRRLARYGPRKGPPALSSFDERTVADKGGKIAKAATEAELGATSLRCHAGLLDDAAPFGFFAGDIGGISFRRTRQYLGAVGGKALPDVAVG